MFLFLFTLDLMRRKEESQDLDEIEEKDQYEKILRFHDWGKNFYLFADSKNRKWMP